MDRPRLVNEVERIVQYNFYRHLNWMERMRVLFDLELFILKDKGHSGAIFDATMQAFKRALEHDKGKGIWRAIQKYIPVEDRRPFEKLPEKE